MERRIENYFPKVLEITEKVFKEELEKQGGIPNEYKGYISTFGTMVLQNGILPALAFFEKNDRKSNSPLEKVPEVIKLFLIEQDEFFKEMNKNEKLVKIIKDKVKTKDGFDREKLRIVEGKVIDISIALKLALRTYLKVES